MVAWHPRPALRSDLGYRISARWASGVRATETEPSLTASRQFREIHKEENEAGSTPQLTLGARLCRVRHCAHFAAGSFCIMPKMLPSVSLK